MNQHDTCNLCQIEPRTIGTVCIGCMYGFNRSQLRKLVGITVLHDKSGSWIERAFLKDAITANAQTFHMAAIGN